MARSTRRLATAMLLSAALALSWSAPASAAIHEVVASFCSGGAGNVDPAGQLRDGPSFLRALQATGVFEVTVGSVPAGQPGPFPGTVPVTVDVDYDHPASKFSALGFYVRFPVDTLTVYLWIGEPDHPAFERCRSFAP